MNKIEQEDVPYICGLCVESLYRLPVFVLIQYQKISNPFGLSLYQNGIEKP